MINYVYVIKYMHEHVNIIADQGNPKIIWKRDPLELQHPKFENRWLGFTESVHERKRHMQHPSRRLASGWALLYFEINVLNPAVAKDQKM